MRPEFEPEIRAFLARAEAIAGTREPRLPSLPRQISEWIADRIQFGDFKPGESVRELIVADHFDVSRGPVREALRILDRDGLVSLQGRKGAVVRELSVEEIEGLFHIRAELFAAQSGLAALAGKREEAAIAAMNEGAALLVRLAEDEAASVGDYIKVRRGVSILIAGISKASYIARLSAVFEREVALLWASVLTSERRRLSAARWGALCKAVENRRGGEAERLARDLVLGGLAEIQRRSAMRSEPQRSEKSPSQRRRK